MRIVAKLTLATATAIVTLAVLVPTTSARRLFVSSRFIMITFPSFEFIVSPVEAECRMTLEATFHSDTFSKVSGSLIGLIKGVSIARPCTGSTQLWALNGIERLRGGETTFPSLPWHIQYTSFNGTLPEISEVTIQIVGASFYMESTLVTCLYKSTQERPLVGKLLVSHGEAATFVIDSSRRIPFHEGNINLCREFATVRGTGNVTNFGVSTAITVRLVP